CSPMSQRRRWPRPLQWTPTGFGRRGSDLRESPYALSTARFRCPRGPAWALSPTWIRLQRLTGCIAMRAPAPEMMRLRCSFLCRDGTLTRSARAWCVREESEGCFPEASHSEDRAGGEGEIRTHVRVSPKHAFQACAFSHSATSPRRSTTYGILT